jgi:hypothetical protein
LVDGGGSSRVAVTGDVDGHSADFVVLPDAANRTVNPAAKGGNRISRLATELVKRIAVNGTVLVGFGDIFNSWVALFDS